MHSIRKSKLINSLLFIIKSCIGVNLTFCQFSIYFSSSSILRIDTAICLLFWFPFQFFAFHSKFIYVQNIIKKSANTFNNQSLIEWNNNEKTKKKKNWISLSHQNTLENSNGNKRICSINYGFHISYTTNDFFLVKTKYTIANTDWTWIIVW